MILNYLKDLYFKFFGGRYFVNNFSFHYEFKLNRYYLKYGGEYLKVNNEFGLEFCSLVLTEECFFLNSLKEYFDCIKKNKGKIKTQKHLIDNLLLKIFDAVIEECSSQIYQLEELKERLKNLNLKFKNDSKANQKDKDSI